MEEESKEQHEERLDLSHELNELGIQIDEEESPEMKKEKLD